MLFGGGGQGQGQENYRRLDMKGTHTSRTGWLGEDALQGSSNSTSGKAQGSSKSPHRKGGCIKVTVSEH